MPPGTGVIDMGADVTVQGGLEDPVAVVLRYTGGRGADVVIESVGTPEAFRLCAEMVAPGGRIASLGVYGRPVTLPMEKLWNRNVTITTRLVNTDSIGQLLALLAAGRLDPTPLVTHTFPMDEFMKAYEVFENAVANDAIKVVVKQ